MACIHQMMLVNQGVHWCELQKDCYPHCEQCLSYQPQPTSETTVTNMNTATNKSTPIRDIMVGKTQFKAI